MAGNRLILFSGLPGCGKTTLARRAAQHFKIPLFAKDRLQSQLRVQGLTGRAGADGYHLILDLAGEQLSLSVSAILDGVFPKQGFRSQAREMARKYKAAFRPVYCFCSDRTIWRQRMQNRVQYVPDWTPVGWEEVERLQAIYEPWEADAALYVDSAGDLESNLLQVIKWITAV